MMKYRLLIIAVMMLLSGSFSPVFSQHDNSGLQAVTLEQQYEEYISGALRHQVKADSLSRSANQKRRELAFITGETQRRGLENRIVGLEHEAFRIQRHADSLYTQARAIELRMMASNRSNPGRGQVASPGASNATGQPETSSATSGSATGPSADTYSGSDQGRQHEPVSGNSGYRPVGGYQDTQEAGPTFLILGEKELNSWLTRRELSEATGLEYPYREALSKLWQISDLDDEMKNLQAQLDAGVSRRERRRIGQRLDEIDGKIFSLHIEALEVLQKVHELRYVAASRFLEEIIEDQDDRDLKMTGLKHQEFADESFRQARGLRETAAGLRSDRYRQEYIVKAYEEEISAFSELEKAMEAYTTIAEPVISDGIPRGLDGRIDPVAVLSRTSRESAPEVQAGASGIILDYGFSILPATPYSEENPVPVNPVFPGGLAYSIQLGLFNAGMNPDFFGGLTPVIAGADKEASTVRYSTGVFRTHSEAERGLVNVNSQGFTDAFIIAYHDGARIPVTRARQIERTTRQAGTDGSVAAGTHPVNDVRPRNGRAETPVSMTPPAPVEPEASAGLEKAVVVSFRVQIAALSRMADKETYERWQRVAGDRKVEYTINNSGLYVYSTGNFNTFEEAVGMRDRFRQGSVPDAYIVPYKDDMRISMEEAGRLLNNQMR